MIKSKIEAREKALELAVRSYQSDAKAPENAILATACGFYSYLVGECELPEQEPSAEELVNKTVDKYLEAFNVPNKEPFNPGAIGIIGEPIN